MQIMTRCLVDDIATDETDRAIVRMVLDGQPNKLIARALNLPLGTVKWRLHMMYARAGVSSRVQFAMKVRDRRQDERPDGRRD